MNLANFKRLLTANAGRRTIYAQGPSGAGKSSVVRQYFDENEEMSFWQDVRLGQRDSGEVKGILLPDLVNMCTMQSRPDYFPLPDEGSDVKGVLVLDEFDHATPAAQSAAYELILDRKIGNYKLPDGIEIVMLSNSRADGGLHFDVPKPIKNRVIMVHVRPDTEEWLVHARSYGINPIILSFIKENPDYLFFGGDVTTDNKGDLGAFASPRSWFTADDTLDFQNVDDLLEEILEGTIGIKTTKAFLDYMVIANSNVSIENILGNKYKEYAEDTDDIEDLSIINYNLECLTGYIAREEVDSSKFNMGIANWIGLVQDNDSRTLIVRAVMGVAPKMLKPLKSNKEGTALMKDIMNDIVI